MWIAATLAAGIVVRHELDEVFDSAIQETAQRVLPLAAMGIIAQDKSRPAQRIAGVRPHDEFLTYLVRNGEGEILLQSHDAEPEIFPQFSGAGFETTPTHRIYTETAMRGTIAIMVAEPLAHRRKAAFEASAALALPLLGLVPASLLGVWWLVRVNMQPVRTFREQIELRGSGDLTPVDAATLPSEIGSIADGVNRLMERLRRALEAERTFTANSAHELRTPVAAALAQTQRLIAEAPPGPLQERASQIEAALRSLARLSEKLMQLAKAEGGGLLSGSPHDVVRLVRLVAEDFLRTAEVSERLHLSLPEDAVLSRMDPDVFAILLRNLIENALKHGAKSEPVKVSLSSDGVLSVSNSGPVIPAEVLARLIRPFARGATPADGTGLGLAIANSIAAGAGARLELLSPASGAIDGFEARVYLDSISR